MGTIFILVLSGLASMSTLAKNELNCSLTTLADCAHVHQMPAGDRVSLTVHYGYEGVTGDANPSLGGK